VRAKFQTLKPEPLPLVCEVMMPFNATQLATDLLSAAYNAGGSLEASLYIADWPDGMVLQTVDAVLAGLAEHKLRLTGIRTDAAGFAQFGIEYEAPNNSGRYRRIPIVRSDVPFGTMQLVFEPERRA
jgi:hypothetical protein